MRTKTIVIVELDEKGNKVGVFCNDPNLDIKVDIVPSGTMKECGSCDHWHLDNFKGDCRDDDNRFVTL